VAILHGSDAAFEKVHVALPRRIAQACRVAGVRRVVHVSALGVGDDGPSLYLRSKAQGEAVLRSAGLDLTILRPSVMFGAEDRFMNLFARLQKFAPFVPLANARAQFQPVWVQDVASAIVACLDNPATAGKVFECAGPEVFTLGELVKLAGRWAGHERPVMPLPAPVGRLQAALMELLPGEPLMSRDNLDSMRLPNISSGRLPSLYDLGIHATPLGSVAPRYLSVGQ
jgi:NADH dehydrogenase